MKYTVFILFFLFLPVSFLNAQVGTFRNINNGDGLMDWQANCFFKDTEGYVWIGGDFMVERCPEGLIVSHNAIVSRRFNKFGRPDKIHVFEYIDKVAGSFTLVPLNGGNWPAAVEKLFGKPDETALPYMPFYHSYDQ